MWAICNQSSLPLAYKQFEDKGGDGSGRSRLLPSGNRERLVDCVEELVEYILIRPHFNLLGDGHSERKEQAEKEAKTAAALAAEEETNIVDKI